MGTITQPGLELPPGSAGDQPGALASHDCQEAVAIALGPDRRSASEITVTIPGGEALGEEDAQRSHRDRGRPVDPGHHGRGPPHEHGKLAGLGLAGDRRGRRQQREAHRGLDHRGPLRTLRRDPLPRASPDGVRADGHLHGRGAETRRRGAACLAPDDLRDDRQDGQAGVTGRMQTHVAGGGRGPRPTWPTSPARPRPRPTSIAAIAAANTARHVEDLIDAAAVRALLRSRGPGGRGLAAEPMSSHRGARGGSRSCSTSRGASPGPIREPRNMPP